MAEKNLLGKEKLLHSGLFNFKGLYHFMHQWLVDEEFRVNEDRYEESVSGDKRKVKVEWKAIYEVSDYFKYDMEVVIKTEKMEDVEVEINGETKKMNKGELEIEMKAALISDQKSKWESSSFTQYMRGIYDKFIIRERTDKYEEDLIMKLRELKDDVKNYIDATASRQF